MSSTPATAEVAVGLAAGKSPNLRCNRRFRDLPRHLPTTPDVQPRPAKGMPAAITVMNSTLESGGRLAM